MANPTVDVGRKYFVLEHAGKSTKFIGDYVEMGRGGQFAVPFGEEWATVSRPHAAIVRRGEGWTLKPLSKSNPTLLNQSPIREETPLRNGDEIRLSYEGPKLLFHLPSNNAVSTLGMTARMKAVMNESVRPYRRAITLILLVFLAATGGLGWYIYHHAPAANSADPSALKALYPGVFYLRTARVVYEIDGEQKEAKFAITGTGFLLGDGRFVTARHVVQPWFFLEQGASDLEKALNIIASNGGKVTHYFTAYSSDGRKLEFSGNDFTVDATGDETEQLTLDDGRQVTRRIASPSDKDWAVARVSAGVHTDLILDREMSKSLRASSQVFALGFPFGIGANGESDIHPSYGACTVSMDGLNKGVIMVSGRSFDHGDSGGPVFALADNKYYVVGIVSAGAGAQGIIVPVSALPQ